MEYVAIVIYVAILVVVFAGMWKAFEKAGAPGWGCLVPIYNFFLMLKMAKKPVWWLILLLVPIANLVVLIIVPIEIAKGFGKSTGFGVGMALLGFIFWPILGFGDARWQETPVSAM